MKKIAISFLVFCLGCQNIYSQEWQSYHIGSYSSYFWWTYESPLNQQFKINFNDSSLWFLVDDGVIKIESDGQLSIYNSDNTSVFNQFLNFKDITFTSDATFLADRDQGIFRFKNDIWSKVSNTLEGVNLTSDSDTVWCSRVNQPYFIIEPLSQSFGNVNYLRRIVSKNGKLWGSSSSEYGILHRKTETGFVTFSAAANGLLDGRNYDFKFSSYSDTLYTCGDIGINLIFGDQVVDSIYPLNCLNMPNLSVLEFEIDQQNNIWAIFGAFNISGQPQKIGFFDRLMNEWTVIYDLNNSPINFGNEAVSIELDPLGNLWVVNGPYLHVLKQGADPGWLSINKLESTEMIKVYPNPSSDELNIESTKNMNFKNLIITDLTGKNIYQIPLNNQSNVSIDVSDIVSGTYLLNFENYNGQTYIERWVKQ